MFYNYVLQEKKFSEERSRFYCAQISLAFLFLHSRGIVYRDLKLDNVMLTHEVIVKLHFSEISKYGLTSGQYNDSL